MKQNISSSVKFGALALALTLTSACENPHLVQLKDEFGWTETKMLKDGWLRSRVVAQPPAYCYHTLADEDCYSKPKPGNKHRLVAPSYEDVF